MRCELRRNSDNELMALFHGGKQGAVVEFELINIQNGIRTIIRENLVETKVDDEITTTVLIDRVHLKRIDAVNDISIKIGRILSM